MYQPQQNQAKISPGLSALMELQRTAAATTPDGTPTIASQVAQKVQGMQGQGQGQEQPQAPQGIAGIAPNLPPQVQNALVGGQIQQQQQQGAEQIMRQMASAEQQKQQQQPAFAQGGIAGLPADNMHNMGRYARGGVIGFYEGDEVPLPNLSEEDKTRMRQSLGNRDTAADFLADQQEKIAMDKTVTNVPTKVPDSLVDKLKQLFAAKETGSVSTGLTPTQQAAIEGAGQTLRQQVTTKPSVDYAAVDAAIRARQGVNAAPAPVGIAKTLPTPTAKPVQLNRPAPAAAAPAPAQTVPGMGMPTMETTADTVKKVNALYPDEDMTEYTKALKAREAVAKEREPSTAIADLTKAEGKRKALEASRLGNYNVDALMKFAFAASKNYGPGAGGAAVAEFDEKQQQLAQMNLQAEAMFDASIRKEKEAAFAIKMGDADKAVALSKEGLEFRQKSNAIKAGVTSAAIGAASTAYNSQMHVFSSELNNKSAERVNDALIKARAADAKLIHGDMLSKQKFINAQAAQLAKEENSPTVLPKHTLAAYAAWEAAGGQVQAALIGAGQREKAAEGAAETKIQIAAQKALSDWTLGAGAKYRKDLSTPEARAAFKNYLSLTHNPAESEGVTGAQILGAMGNAGAGAAPGAGGGASSVPANVQAAIDKHATK